MSLLRIREERKKLGSGARRGPKTVTLILLLVLVLLLMLYLGRLT
ncbi:MAG: hypothetical protein ACE5HP_00845 [Gemmatimonadota bacterium]